MKQKYFCRIVLRCSVAERHPVQTRRNQSSERTFISSRCRSRSLPHCRKSRRLTATASLAQSKRRRTCPSDHYIERLRVELAHQLADLSDMTCASIHRQVLTLGSASDAILLNHDSSSSIVGTRFRSCRPPIGGLSASKLKDCLIPKIASV